MIGAARHSVGFSSGSEHLAEELQAADLLIRAATHAWRVRIAQDKPADAWGMVLVDEAEVDRFLAAPFAVPAPVPESVLAEWSVLRAQAAAMEEQCALRLSATDVPHELPLAWLVEALALSDIERRALLVVLLGTTDERYRRLFGYLQDDASRKLPSVELVLRIIDPALATSREGQKVFAANETLVRSGLVQLQERGDTAAVDCGVRVDERIVAFLQGADIVPAELVDRIELLPIGSQLSKVLVVPETAEQLQRAVSECENAAELGGPIPLQWFCGVRGSQRRPAALAFATMFSDGVIHVDHRDVPVDVAERHRFVRVVTREALLRRAAILWRIDTPLEEDALTDLLPRLQEHGGPVVMIACDELVLSSNIAVTPTMVRFLASTVELRELAWRQALGSLEMCVDAPGLIPSLAAAYHFSVGEIEAVSAAAAQGVAQTGGGHSAAILAECRRRSSASLGGMANRLEPTDELSFDDLVLPAASRKQIDDLRVRIANRRRVYEQLGLRRHLANAGSLCALFSGPSGTGKSLAARLLASERHVALYRVDLATVVSKYVGETEKNLGRLFDEAERANAILFFDEADSLFGKRGDVKEARDRWANLEVNYLLQRIESFNGVVILASNLRQNIDGAFMRRMHAVVEFPLPDASAREHIWRRLLPSELGLPADECIGRIARRFELAGGSIRNVVIDATFRAVADAAGGDPVISMQHVAGALGREFQKAGRPVTRTEFGDDLYPHAEAEVLGHSSS